MTRVFAKRLLRRVIRGLRYDVVSFRPEVNHTARMRQLLAPAMTDVVLDVGANAGQYAAYLRERLDYAGRIVSFEPLDSAFDLLVARASNDPAWTALNYALGSVNSTGTLNVAANSHSSSLLPMLAAHLRSAPDSAYRGVRSIPIRTLDSVIGEHCLANDRIFMKVDVQGFEREVLAGAEASLRRMHAVQLEMSLVPLYEGESLFAELCEYMRARAFVLIAIVPGFADGPTGQLLQVDGVFRRLHTWGIPQG